MIEAFHGNDADDHPQIFGQMYRQRHEIYVKERNWSDLKTEDGLERDEFDHDESLYLVALSEEREVWGSLRLLPTTVPHLFSKYFPDLAAGSTLPMGEDTYELTRFYVTPSCRSIRLRFWLTGVMACGMFEYCLENGIRQLTSVLDTFLLHSVLQAGWQVTPLGLPRPYKEGTAVGVRIDVTRDSLWATRRSRGVQERVLTTASHPVPPIPTDPAKHVRMVGLRAN